MDSLVEISPPVALKLKLSEEWFEQVIKSFLPFDIQQDNIQVQLLAPFDIKILPSGLKLEFLIKLNYPFKLMGAVNGKAKVILEFKELADIDLIDVRLLHLDWIEGPRLTLNKYMGFSIRRLVSDQMEKAKKKVETSLQEGIPEGFKAFTETSPFYHDYLNQVIPDLNVQVKTKVKTLFYQFAPGNKWLDLQLFPELELNISDTDNQFIGAPGPFKPGVGGGQITFQMLLSMKYVNEFIAEKVKGQELKAGNKVVKIDEVILGAGTDGFVVNVSFDQDDPPKINGLILPRINIQKQIIEFEIQHLEMQEASWFWRGLLSLLKSSIKSRIEESLTIDIGQLLKDQTPKLETQLSEILSAQNLQLKLFQPAFCIKEIQSSLGGLVINGGLGGNFEIWSDHLIATETAQA